MSKGMGISVFPMALGILLGLAPASWGAPRVIEIRATEFKFEPSRITVKAGETITIRFLNQSKQKKEHELMIGRKVKMSGPFKDRPDGFEHDFFEGLHVKYMGGKNVKMVMAGEAKLEKIAEMKMGGMKMAGAKEKDDHGKEKMAMKKDEHGSEKKMSGMKMGGHGDEHAGFMVQLLPHGDSTITFTVPGDKVGKWEIGCFSEDGTHYKEKMIGELIVTK